MLRYILLVMIAPALAACQGGQPPRTCDEVSARTLRSIMEQPGSPVEVRAKIADIYGLPLDQVVISAHGDATSFQWSKDNVAASMGMDGANPVDGGLYYHARPPSVATVIGCLRLPDYYRAYYQRGGPEASWNSLELDLYFVQQGVLGAAYVRGSGKEPPKLGMDLPVQAFRFVRVGSVEETMARLNDHYSAEFLRQIKPWPGRLEDVVIETDPDLRR